MIRSMSVVGALRFTTFLFGTIACGIPKIVLNIKSGLSKIVRTTYEFR